MELEILFPTVAGASFGAIVWILAAIAAAQVPQKSTVLSERRAWWRLVGPLGAGALVLAFLVGWVLQEPDPADERAAIGVTALATVTALVALRAVWRAIVAVRLARRIRLPIATVGLFRCRCVVSDEFRRTTSPEALRAALTHEMAHARGRDPLRIWVAQFAADLQWPVPAAQRRLDAWLLALEVRRDDEAVASGAARLALAEALLIAARQVSVRIQVPAAGVAAGDSAGVALRVRRLLQSDPIDGSSRAAWRVGAAYAAALLASVWLGLVFGEALLRLLPGVGR